jgi:hypothetical protein
MKVLWFSATPCNGANYLMNKHIVGGWLQSLESELKIVEEIELSVCFVHPNKMDSITLFLERAMEIFLKNGEKCGIGQAQP